MPTIAELLAAKKAKLAGTSNVERPTSNVEGKAESIAERIELKEAIDRIDPKGKSKAASLVLSQRMPEQVPEPEPARKLAAPLSQAPTFQTDAAWGAVLASTVADLCVMRDPADPEACWLAVRHIECTHPPIMILCLPWLLWEHPQAAKPEEEPY